MLHLGPIPLDSSSHHRCQRTCHLAESPHKSPIVRCQSKEATYVMNTLRSGPLNNCPDLPRRSLDSSRADFKTKIFHLVFQEFALMKLPLQLGFPELAQRPPKVLPMLVHIATEDQYIVEVYCNELIQISSEDLNHQPLKSGWCIRQPKWHDEKLEVASVSTKSCFLD